MNLINGFIYIYIYTININNLIILYAKNIYAL